VSLITEAVRRNSEPSYGKIDLPPYWYAALCEAQREYVLRTGMATVSLRMRKNFGRSGKRNGLFGDPLRQSIEPLGELVAQAWHEVQEERKALRAELFPFMYII